MRALSYADLREFPEHTAERMMVSYGSKLLLSATHGTEPPEWPVPHHREPRQYIPKPRARRPARHRSEPGPIARAIMHDAATAFGINAADLNSDNRSPVLVYARAVVIRLLRDRLNPDGTPRFSTAMIGDYLHRDHSTVCHALSRFEDYCRFKPQVRDVYEALRRCAA